VLGKEGIMKILVAIDGSLCSEAALEEVASRPWPTGSEIGLVMAIDPWPPVGGEGWALPPHYYDDVARALRESADGVLAAARERFAGSEGVTVTSTVLTGTPARAVVDEAERWEADLVVVGSHGHGVLKRFLLGSVSHAIAMHAHCSVELVRKRHAS
jgi:nucleotide-binding universal stress UspA family protein